MKSPACHHRGAAGDVLLSKGKLSGLSLTPLLRLPLRPGRLAPLDRPVLPFRLPGGWPDRARHSLSLGMAGWVALIRGPSVYAAVFKPLLGFRMVRRAQGLQIFHIPKERCVAPMWRDVIHAVSPLDLTFLPAPTRIPEASLFFRIAPGAPGARRRAQAYRPPLYRLHGTQSIWQFSATVLPPLDHGWM